MKTSVHKILKTVKGTLVIIVLLLCFLPLHSGPVTYAGKVVSPPNYALKTIVIDAGHGGKDPGCRGAKAKEKNVALSIALKLGKYIEDNMPEVRVVYTRKTDIFIPLDERAAIANRNKADFFISIHCNAVSSNTQIIRGTETYVMGNKARRENIEVAKRENAVILMEDNYLQRYDGFDPNSPETHIMNEMYVNGFMEQSLQLAAKVENQFKSTAKRKSRGVQQASFVVLRKTAMPSILVEVGFLTHRTEEKYLVSKDGQYYIAASLYRAFQEYKYDVEGIKSGKDVVYSPENTPKTKENPKPEAKKPIVKSEPIQNEAKAGPVGSKYNVEYRIQLASSDVKLSLNEAKWSSIEEIISIEVNGIHKYMTGHFLSVDEAINQQVHFRKNGFPGAFVVAFKNNERISVSAAKKLLRGK